jgi:hypothetical protein
MAPNERAAAAAASSRRLDIEAISPWRLSPVTRISAASAEAQEGEAFRLRRAACNFSNDE